MKKWAKAVGGALLLVVMAGQAQPAARRLASHLGFSVARPAGWRQAPRSDGAIEMLSSGPGAEGVVIARRQADIVVSAVDLPAGRTLADVIAVDVGDDRVVGRSTLPGPSAPDRCGPLLAVNTLDGVGPGVDQRITLLYCHIGSRAWRIGMRCWQSDPAPLKRRWRDTTVAVARSLRFAAT